MTPYLSPGLRSEEEKEDREAREKGPISPHLGVAWAGDGDAQYALQPPGGKLSPLPKKPQCPPSATLSQARVGTRAAAWGGRVHQSGGLRPASPPRQKTGQGLP